MQTPEPLTRREMISFQILRSQVQCICKWRSRAKQEIDVVEFGRFETTISQKLKRS
jgi:hypothetical protein